MSSGLTGEQRRIAQQLITIGRKRGATPMEIKAALETGLVESGLRNLSYGDADSQGWRQERASLYKNPTNLTASINRFYDETRAARGKYGNAGDLAAAVQRPAAQYRSRYAQRAGEADAIMRSLGAGGVADTPASSSLAPQAAAADNTGASRQQLLLSYLQQRNNPNALLSLASGLKQLDASPGAAAGPGDTGTVPQAAPSGGGDTPQLNAILAEANRIDAAKVPYQWGGGHAAKQPRGSKVTPLDCSGAVSRALGINPRVSGQFAKWGEAGPGRQVTIYANSEHVLMKIGNRFWGTSRSNPGGGAGWIPASAVSADYLKRFTARHPPGL